jgi:hypothetical protein
MSLEKAIKHGKEHRKEYHDSRRWDCGCRNHGSCSYCRSNRTIFDKRARARTEGQENEYFGYWFMPDPYDALQAESEKTYRKMGLTPNDWDTLVELGELFKG